MDSKKWVDFDFFIWGDICIGSMVYVFRVFDYCFIGRLEIRNKECRELIFVCVWSILLGGNYDYWKWFSWIKVCINGVNW